MIRFRVLQMVLIAVGCTCWGGAAQVQGLVGGRPLAGYACMWVMGGKAPAYVYARPSERSATVGVGGEMVIATSPLHLVGGFGEILRRDGRHGWIAASLARGERPAAFAQGEHGEAVLGDAERKIPFRITGPAIGARQPYRENPRRSMRRVGDRGDRAGGQMEAGSKHGVYGWSEERRRNGRGGVPFRP